MTERRIIWILGVIVAIVFLGLWTGNHLAKNPIFVFKAVCAVTAVAFVLFRGIKPGGLTHYQYAYYCCYVLALLLAFNPSKALAYLAPSLSILFFIVYLSVCKEQRVLTRLSRVITALAVLFVFYKAVNPDFVNQNLVIAFFTYSSFIFILIVPTHRIAGGELFSRIVKFSSIILIIEGSIGFIQGVGAHLFSGRGGSAGDLVEGTIHIMPEASTSLSNPIYCFNIMFCVLLVLVFSYIHNKKIPKRVYFAVLAFGMATVVHLMIFWAVAFVGAFVLVRPKVRSRGKSSITAPLIAVVLIVLVGCLVLLSGAGSVEKRFENLKGGGNHKAKMFELLVTDVPEKYPTYFALGAGPGQFGSRAAAISAGYLGRLPPGFSFSSTPLFNEYLLGMWIEWIGMWWRSAGNSPESSWFAVISEEGVLGFSILLWLMGSVVLKAVRHAHRNPSKKMYTFGFITGLLAIFLAGFSSFYWEVPQVVFVGCMVTKLFHAEMYFVENKVKAQR